MPTWIFMNLRISGFQKCMVEIATRMVAVTGLAHGLRDVFEL